MSFVEPYKFPQQALEGPVNDSLNIRRSEADSVNHPAHYTSGKIECIDAIESATQGLEGIEAVCTANALKYLWRWKQKNGVEDLKKARWYLDRLIDKSEPK